MIYLIVALAVAAIFGAIVLIERSMAAEARRRMEREDAEVRRTIERIRRRREEMEARDR